MIKPEQIPKEVVATFRDAWMDADKTTEAAIAAAINAWPEAKAAWFLPQGKVYMLPAPWENPKREKNDD